MGEQPSLGALKATNTVKGYDGDDKAACLQRVEIQQKGKSLGVGGGVGGMYNGTTLKGITTVMPLS